MSAPSFYTIPPGCSFAIDLAKGLLQDASSPEILAKTQILLPTKRAVRALSAAFTQVSDGKALLLPKMTALGDMDDDDHEATSYGGLGLASDGALPPAISDMRRLCLIARQIQSFPIAGQRPSQAQSFTLARTLIQLFDQVQNAEFDIAQMRDLWPADLASHWQDIARFLEILWTYWPTILAAEKAMDPVARRIALMERRGQLWQDQPPQTPVIIAGSTGTLPATQKLMRVISQLPQGQIIFPGLLPFYDADDWQDISQDKVHPLHPLSVTMAALNITPDDVAVWPASQRISDATYARQTFMSEVMRPASQTDKWRKLPDAKTPLTEAATYDGFRRIEAEDTHEEAAIIALLMRQSLEVPKQTALLVTADRQLARMVQSELRRFDIEIDDSAGAPLSHSLIGSYLHYLASLIAPTDFISDLVTLAGHPFATGQMARVPFRQKFDAFNLAFLRGPLTFFDQDSLRDFAHNQNAADQQDLVAFLTHHVLDLLAPLCDLGQKSEVTLSECAKILGQVAEAFAATKTDDLSDAIAKLWSGYDGEAAAKLLSDLADYGGDMLIAPSSFVTIFADMMAGQVVRKPYQSQSRLAIVGAVESRMISADLVILSGLNEGVWPPRATRDLWMNSQMANDIGLPDKQWRIALSAHDFMMAATMKQVVITRARRQNGQPTLPSRWLTRMDAVMAALKIEDLIKPHMPDDVAAILQWRKSQIVQPIAPPNPKPPIAYRPVRFSATQFDVLIGDPYAVYARSVLGLRSLDGVNEKPNAALKGTIYHEALHLFTKAHPTGEIGPHHEQELIAIGDRLMAPYANHYEVAHFWKPQFAVLAKWFVAHDAKWRDRGQKNHVEIKGSLILPVGTKEITITAKADRIIVAPDGTVTILDYKTGRVPSKKAVQGGRRCQMLVETVLVTQGAFPDIDQKDDAPKLVYVKLKGRGEQAGEITDMDLGEEVTSSDIFDAMTALLLRFEDPEMGYRSEPDGRGRQDYSDYRHLARVKEWRVLEADSD
ncbi:MAG: double-strand break repair protein AddB [Candidatus Puniceispirillaceae bacterium]